MGSQGILYRKMGCTISAVYNGGLCKYSVFSHRESRISMVRCCENATADCLSVSSPCLFDDLEQSATAQDIEQYPEEAP